MIPHISLVPTSWQTNLSTQGQDLPEMRIAQNDRFWGRGVKCPSNDHVSIYSSHIRHTTLCVFIVRGKNLHHLLLVLSPNLTKQKLKVNRFQFFNKYYQIMRVRFKNPSDLNSRGTMIARSSVLYASRNKGFLTQYLSLIWDTLT